MTSSNEQVVVLVELPIAATHLVTILNVLDAAFPQSSVRFEDDVVVITCPTQ